MKMIIKIISIFILISVMFGCATIRKGHSQISLMMVDTHTSNGIAFDSEIVIQDPNEAMENYNFVKALDEIFEDIPAGNTLSLSILELHDGKISSRKKALVYFPGKKVLCLITENSSDSKLKYGYLPFPFDMEDVIRSIEGSFYLAIRL